MDYDDYDERYPGAVIALIKLRQGGRETTLVRRDFFLPCITGGLFGVIYP
jgi:hypothetical protein